MKEFFRRVSPKRAIVDFAETWRQPTPHRWPILGVAIALTFFTFMLFIPKSQRVPPPKPDVIWITTYAPDRTRAQIIASNCANQQLMDELQKRLDERANLRREMYAALGRATFINVDKILKEAKEERAKEIASGKIVTPEQHARSVAEYCAQALSKGTRETLPAGKASR